MKEKIVSVIIPTYNRENWIKEAVESIFCQSYSNYEIIVVDDGSTDNTKRVLAPFKSKIRYVFQPTSGPSSARNKGLQLSRGEWIAFLDSDDVWRPEKLEKQMDVLQKEPEFKVCYTDEVWIRNGKFVNPRKRHTKYSGWIYPYCLPLCIISPSSVVIHRSVFEEVGYFDTSLPVAEDYDLWLRISSRYPIKLVPEKLIIKRGGHPDQLSKKYWGIDRFRIIALEKMLRKNYLPVNWRIATLKELAKKASIVAEGCRKRGKWKEYHCYATKAKEAEKEIAYLLS
ncbi:glycosyltransferase family 2 protein [Candidatus Aerophobetes bacterium]|uniref:Glycosyltransferase family 2 protein n=1 Tax=Aerophobetes bacterium TaxID=2030807 RepID=A0A662DEM9_UNCAE|nr:MAG: glycosyltransferase family 2 protein [Candidatus Aerophobetes bacterium]